MNSIVECLAYYAKKTPEKTAVIAEELSITYGELWEQVCGFASYLKSCGLKKGDRVVVKARHALWFPVSCMGIHLAGGVHAPVEKTIGGDGLRDIAEQLCAELVISDLEPEHLPCRYLHSDKVQEIAKAHYDSSESFSFPEREDLCDIMFTTGTTGKSKGVMESHRAVYAVVENVSFGVPIPEDTVYLIPTPLNHAAAIRKFYVCIQTGTTAVFLDGFTNVKLFYDYIRRYGVTAIHMPPSAVRMMLLLSSKEMAKYADQLYYIHTGSASFPEADKERLCKLLPNTKLCFAYGSSEAGCVSLFDYSRYPGKIGCVGKPNKNAHIFIVDDEYREMESSREKQGLIAMTGDVVMSGYYNEPELTKEVLRDGIVYTNDIGYIDEEGFIYMLGRRGDVINVGGLKIAPTEVENVVLKYPGIAECACFAVEDRMGGSVPKLNIVPEEQAEIDLTALRAYMSNYLEAFKVPKLIAIVDVIPKNKNDKIDRKALK